VVGPSGNVEPEVGAQVGVSGPSTASEAVAVYVTAAPDELVASAVMLAGTVTVGAPAFCTVTVNDLLDEFPAASAALQLTVVVPFGNVEPDAGVQPKLVTPTASVAFAVYVTAAPDAPVLGTVMLAGTVMTGAVLSATVTLNVLLELLFAASF